MQEREKPKWSHSVVSDFSQPHGLKATRLLRPWDFPGKSTGVGCHCLLTKVGEVQLLFSLLPPSAPLKPLPYTGIPHWVAPGLCSCSPGEQRQECHLCVLPLPGSSLPVSRRKEFIPSSAVLVLRCRPADTSRSPGSLGQLGLCLHSHSTVYISLWSTDTLKLLAEGLGSYQLKSRCWLRFLATLGDTDRFQHSLHHWEPLKTNTAAWTIPKVWETTQS